MNTFTSAEDEHGDPLQYSCLENPMDGGPWRAKVHRVSKSWTQMSNSHTHTHTHTHTVSYSKTHTHTHTHTDSYSKPGPFSSVHH